MTNERDATLPLEVAPGEAGPHATDAFSLLGNETRLAILLALWETYDPHATDNMVPFSELYALVDYDDPGSFRYHLRQLDGQFIRHSEDAGYELKVPGRRFIQAVIAGAGVQDATLEPTIIDQPCPFCDEPTVIQYSEGLLIHSCTDCAGVTTDAAVPGFLSAVPLDPAGLTNRTPAQIRAASRVAAWRQTQFMFDGLCPACSSPVPRWLDHCPDHDPNGICDLCGSKYAVVARFECQVCKNHNVSSPKALALFHPAVIAFYETRGVGTRFQANDFESVRRVFDLMKSHAVEVLADNPLRVAVTVDHDADEIRLTFDENARVIAVNQPETD